MIVSQSSVVSVTSLSADYFVIAFDAPQIAPLCKPGHFLNFRIENNYDILLRRPMAVFDVDGSIVKSLIKVVGKGTRWLSQRRVGDQLNVIGPLGNGFFDAQNARRIFIVAGGVGLAPLYFYLKKARSFSVETIFFYGARTANHLLFIDDLQEFSTQCVFITEDGSFGEKGLSTDILESYCEKVNLSAQNDIVMSCGPNPMLFRVAQFAESKQIPCQVSLESYMGCGGGVCLSCVIPARSYEQDGQAFFKLCTDGPVIDSRRIDMKFFTMAH
ncbi:dihydroorotate dehydrogenase electron transfer subunit [bacterium]|nr:dihydroorotate dehydrogenase electron transfer subunit [bacterium]MCP5462904.1 dihydroorotate dehydrogenase electron transfer subunit [bacterium]